MSLRLPEDVLRAVEEIAAEQHVSRSEILRAAVTEWVAARRSSER
ncbi:ribbon-helix-helix protein, CopG family [Salinarimonas ramus]|nr:ribbon-helix-helix protein, CopG family [Salinarimonas ramus]